MSSSTRRPTIICVHGGPGWDGSYFRPWLEPLHKVASLQIYHQRAGTMEELVEELRLLANDAPGPRILLGHAFGGALILETLKRHPELEIAGLVLVSWVYDSETPGIFAFYHGEQLDSAQVGDDDPLPMTDEAYKQETLALIERSFSAAARKVGQSILEAMSYDAQTLRTVWTKYGRSYDLKPFLRSIDIPLLSISGKLDGIVQPEHTKRGCQMTACGTHHTLETAGHFPFVDQKTRFASLVSGFLDDLDREWSVCRSG